MVYCATIMTTRYDSGGLGSEYMFGVTTINPSIIDHFWHRQQTVDFSLWIRCLSIHFESSCYHSDIVVIIWYCIWQQFCTPVKLLIGELNRIQISVCK